MEAHRISVLKTARYYTLGTTSEQLTDIWFVCHGYRQLAGSFLQRFTALDNGHTLVVSPEALNRFYVEGYNGRVGASWMTKEDRLADISDYVAYLNHLFERVTDPLPLERIRVHVLGFSQGTATASRFVGVGTKHVDTLVLWAGQFATDLSEESIARNYPGVKVHLVVGTKDEFINEATIEAHETWLQQNGIEYELHRFDGGHTIHEPTLTALANTLAGR